MLNPATIARQYLADKRRGYEATVAKLTENAEYEVRTITVLDDNGFPVRTVDMTVRTRTEARG